MAKNIAPGSQHQQGMGEAEQSGSHAWLRPRTALFLGIGLLGLILVFFLSGRFRSFKEGVAVAAQAQNDLLSARAYQFTGQGKIMGGSGMTWVIGGVPVLVSDQTKIENGIHPGDAVSVLGQITKDGKWLAESVNLVSDQESFFSFGGPLEARSQKAWRVAGYSLTVNDQTKLGDAIQDNELVLATFKVLPDGTWLGLDIEALTAVSPTPTAQPTAVSTMAPAPSYPAGKNNNGCSQGKGKGNWKHGRSPCSGSDQGNNNEGDD